MGYNQNQMRNIKHRKHKEKMQKKEDQKEKCKMCGNMCLNRNNVKNHMDGVK